VGERVAAPDHLVGRELLRTADELRERARFRSVTARDLRAQVICVLFRTGRDARMTELVKYAIVQRERADRIVELVFARAASGVERVGIRAALDRRDGRGERDWIVGREPVDVAGDRDPAQRDDDE
jgi:hypothetical protein